jgi:ATP/maltotriose-dependent transcriptional regulator MalT
VDLDDTIAPFLEPSRPAVLKNVFVGRQAELQELGGALEAVRAGHPRLIAVEGPPGIGKTTLVQRFLNQSGELLILRTRGEDMEATLAYGVVEQLLARLEVQLPDPLGHLQSMGERAADPFAVGAALVDLLGVLQQEGPVVIVIDDAQWADPLSLQALTFALRRLRVDRVLAIVVARDLADGHIPGSLRRALTDEYGHHLRLSGLAWSELGDLASQLGTDGLTGRALRQLRDHTQGNPLHARALLEEVPAETLHEVSRPLPAPRSFALLVLRRLASCPAAVVDLVAAAAVLGGMCLFELAAQLAELTEPLPALEQAIAARLLQERSGGAGLTIAFCHPLIRAAVYQALGPTRRTYLHGRAATLIDDQAIALQHQVLAANGPDPQLADNVARLARQQMMAGAWTSAADEFRAAARLLRSSPEQERLLLEAIECMLMAGDVAGATTYTERIQAGHEPGWQAYILGRLATVKGQLREAEAHLNKAWSLCEPTVDAALCARVAGMLALQCILEARSLEGVRWADHALHLDPTAAGTDMIRYLKFIGLATAGLPEDALALGHQLPHPAAASSADLDALLGRGLVRMWTDDLTGADHDLTGLVSVAPKRSAPFRILVLAALAQTEYRLGRWDDGLIHAELAMSLARDADQQWVAVYGHAMAAMILAGRGDWPPAEAHVAAGWAAISGPEYPAQVAYAALADAHLRAAQADPAGVIRALRPLLALEGRDGINEPGVIPWHDLLVDAWAALGEHEKATVFLEQWEGRAVERGRRSVQAAAARARGNLEAVRGNATAAELAYQAGLEYLQDVDEPFGRALLEAAYGGFLRRTGRRAKAAAQLHSAREGLVQLDARPYLERCDRELVACGLTLTRREAGVGIRLTPQELAVARLAATGLTNRQVATELVVSVKTVEYHLAKVFTKFSISSRTELRAHLNYPDDPRVPTSKP